MVNTEQRPSGGESISVALTAQSTDEIWMGYSRAPKVLVGLLIAAALFLGTAGSAPALTLGVQWNGDPTQMAQAAQEMDMIQKAGASTFRLMISPKVSKEGPVEWGVYDEVFRAAAEHGVTILPHFHGRMNGEDGLPLSSEKTTWSEWAKKAVRRYGYKGTFWSQYPSVPTRPVFAWEMLNEPNNNSFMNITGKEYGEFLQWAGPAVQTASESWGGQKTGVLFGGVLAWSGGTTWQTFFVNAYAVPGVPSAFTGFAIHPYELDTSKFSGTRIEAFTNAVSSARTLLNNNGASGKSLWVTEVGWPVAFQWAVTEPEQANLLKGAIGWAKSAAASLDLKGLIWYAHRDREVSTWQYRCGLRREDGSFRPSWFAFQEEAGAPRWPPGDAHPVSMRDPVTSQFWIYYRAADSYIWELYRNPSTGVWSNTKVPNVQAAAAGTSPAIGRNATTNAQWIYYQGADSYIWELYRNPSTGVWSNTKVPNVQAAAAGTSPVMMGDPSAGAAWIYYQGADSYIWELYRNPSTGVWSNTKVPNVQAAAAGTSPAIGRNATTNAQWIYYQGADSYIWELYRNPSTGVWSNTKVPNVQAAAAGTSPVMMGDPSAGAAWIYYRGSDSYIWELWRNPSTGVWANTKVPNVQAAAAGTSPAIGRNATTNAQWIYYQGADSYIWELYRNPSTGVWSNTKVPNAQAAAAGSSPTMLGDPSTGEAWIEYRGSDSYIWELWRNPSTGVWANGKFPTAQM